MAKTTEDTTATVTATVKALSTMDIEALQEVRAKADDLIRAKAEDELTKLHHQENELRKLAGRKSRRKMPTRRAAAK